MEDPYTNSEDEHEGDESNVETRYEYVEPPGHIQHHPDPVDLGAEIKDSSELEIGNLYYFRAWKDADTTTRCIKFRLTHMDACGGTIIMTGTDEAGQPFGRTVRLDIPRAMAKVFHVLDMSSVKHAVARVFNKKLSTTAVPGKGPANTIREMLGIQPRTGGYRRSRRKTRARKIRARKTRSRRA